MARRLRFHRRDAQTVLGLCAVALIALLQLFAADPSRAELTGQARTGSAFFAIDGDTIEARATGERIRIANIDTPETGERAQCPAERQRGELAKRRVGDLLLSADAVLVDPVGRVDAYGRTVAYVRVNGRDLGFELISENLARPWRGRREPWCSANGGLLL